MRYKQVLLAFSYLALFSLMPLSARTKIGDEYLAEGQRAEQRQDYETALQLYDYAVEEEPNDPAYVAAVQRARLLAAEKRRVKGRKLIERQLLGAARVEFQEALRIDPESKETQEEIRKLDQQMRALPPPIALEAPNDPIYRIQIRRNSPHEVYGNIAVAAGITVTFDSDVRDAPADSSTAGEVSGVSVEDALNVAARTTQTSWTPVGRTAIHVSRARQPVSAPIGVSRFLGRRS